MRILLVVACSCTALGVRAGVKDTVYAYILKYDIKHPEIVLRQAILETGWFRAPFLMSRNNLFGFRASKKYMCFDSLEECVAYYKTWQQERYTNPEENYYHFLHRIRFSRAQDYITILKRINLARSEGAPQPPPDAKTKKPVKK